MALIQTARGFSLCARTEAPPYRHVTVEGLLSGVQDPSPEEQRRAVAVRYLGPEEGER